MKAHKAATHGELRFFCEECGEGFRLATNLRKHIKSKHIKLKEICDICGKSVAVVGRKSHALRHSDVRPYKCPYSPCSETFKETSTIMKHVYQHAKLRPFNCLQCSTGYYMVKYLQGHYQRTHGISYTHKETLINCRREKPPFPAGVTLASCKSG